MNERTFSAAISAKPNEIDNYGSSHKEEEILLISVGFLSCWGCIVHIYRVGFGPHPFPFPNLIQVLKSSPTRKETKAPNFKVLDLLGFLH